MVTLKELIKAGLSDTTLVIKERGVRIYAMTCFWSKVNFSAIIKYHGRKFYCFYDNSIQDIVVQNA